MVISPKTGTALPEPISVRIPEAVRLTGLSRSRIYELMKSREIEFVKVGSSTLILVDSLRTFIDGRRSAAP
ncbi:MAG TPA: helix-turn-helix domain-containing protein [Allosphingosinicella sp.]|jgi:excisionase family DNA binding protein